MTDKSNLYVVVSSFFPYNVAVSLELFGNNGYLLAESENRIMGIKLGITVSAPWCTRSCSTMDMHAQSYRSFQNFLLLSRIIGAQSFTPVIHNRQFFNTQQANVSFPHACRYQNKSSAALNSYTFSTNAHRLFFSISLAANRYRAEKFRAWAYVSSFCNLQTESGKKALNDCARW